MMDDPGLLFCSFLGYHRLLKARGVCSPTGLHVSAPRKPGNWIHWNFMENEGQWVMSKLWQMGFRFLRCL